MEEEKSECGMSGGKSILEESKSQYGIRWLRLWTVGKSMYVMGIDRFDDTAFFFFN